MDSTVLLIHGFNVSDRGRSTVDRLKPYLQDHKIVDIDYPWLGLIGTTELDSSLAEHTAKVMEQERKEGNHVTVVGHSNGATIAHLASNLLSKDSSINYFVYINPALQRDLAPGPEVQALDVFFSNDDIPNRIGEWLYKLLPNILDRLRPWGDMGVRGYQGISDSRIMNRDEESTYKLLTKTDKKFGHSTFFKDGVIETMGLFLDILIKDKAGINV